jgi:hypothetical protein
MVYPRMIRDCVKNVAVWRGGLTFSPSDIDFL